MIERVHNHRRLIISVAMAVVTFVVYLPVRNHEFLSYDDPECITANPDVQSGITWQSIGNAFTKPHYYMWHPLTTLMNIVNYELFGPNPSGHHLVSLALHIANTVLLFLIIANITGTIWQSAFVAAAFALHPLQVESVAWATELKIVLSGLFWLLTMAVYIWYAKRPGIRRYVAVFSVYGLCIMTKPVVVTLPLVLLLLDYWPLGRLKWRRDIVSRLITEKIPLLALSVILSVITFVSQRQGKTVLSLENMPIAYRVANAINSYLAYIGKMIWPSGLAVLYPYPVTPLPTIRTIIFAAVFVLITILTVYYRPRRKYLTVGWLWYVITLIPVIGIVQVGNQAMADRYAYIPFIGLFLIIAFGAADLFEKIPFKKIVLAASAGVILFALAVVTSIQLSHWKNSLTLFEHTIAVTKNNYTIYNNYAGLIAPLGRYEEAVKYLSEAIKLMPDYPEAHNNLGNVLKGLGDLEGAIEHYNTAIKFDPNFTTAHYNLAAALAAKGDYNGAIEQCKIYLTARPDDAQTHTNLGILLQNQGKLDEAKESYKKALQIDPNLQRAKDNLTALGRQDNRQ